MTVARSEGRTTVRGCGFAHDLAGDAAAPAVVWGHGLNSSRTSERSFGLFDLDGLAGDLRLLRYDARTHGETETADLPRTGAGAPNAWREMALDQLALAGACGIDRHVAAGASLGAATALWAAVLAPDRIQRLVLVIPPTGWETRAAQTDRYELMARIVDDGGVQPLIDGIDQAPVPDPFVGDPAWTARSIDTLRSADPVRLARRLRDAGTADLPDRVAIAALSMPMTILAWTGDPGHPIDTVEELRHLRPDAEVHVAPTADDLAAWPDLLRRVCGADPEAPR